MTKRNPRSPFGPIKTSLGFPQLQSIARQLEKPLSCGMCGHEFSPEASTPDHDCKPPMFHVEVVEVKPLEMPRSSVLQYMRDESYPGEDELPDIITISPGVKTP